MVKGRKEWKKPKKSHLPVRQLLSCDDRAHWEDIGFLSCHILTCERLKRSLFVEISVGYLEIQRPCLPSPGRLRNCEVLS